MIETAPRGKRVSAALASLDCQLRSLPVIKVARRLDDDRKHGNVRSKLHGVPILIKWVGAGCAAADR